MDRELGREFVVPAAQVLHERVPGRDNAQRSDRLHTAHLPQLGLESAVISFHARCSRTAQGHVVPLNATVPLEPYG
jgi:hypothetical protein